MLIKWQTAHGYSSVARPKSFGGPKCLILGEQQYFLWDTTSQSTK